MTTAEGGPPVAQLIESRERFIDYVRRRVNDPELAEDIVQDSLLRALKSGPELRSQERLIPWFFQILRNAVVDEYRKRDVIRRHVHEGATLPDLPAAEEDERAMCACFRPLLGNLKPEYSEIIESLEFGDESPEQVGLRLGITPNNLKVRRHRARQALRQQLEAACGTCAQGRCIGACTC